jgi:hypothetical protein
MAEIRWSIIARSARFHDKETARLPRRFDRLLHRREGGQVHVGQSDVAPLARQAQSDGAAKPSSRAEHEGNPALDAEIHIDQSSPPFARAPRPNLLFARASKRNDLERIVGAVIANNVRPPANCLVPAFDGLD